MWERAHPRLIGASACQNVCISVLLCSISYTDVWYTFKKASNRRVFFGYTFNNSFIHPPVRMSIHSLISHLSFSSITYPFFHPSLNLSIFQYINNSINMFAGLQTMSVHRIVRRTAIRRPVSLWSGEEIHSRWP